MTLGPSPVGTPSSPGNPFYSALYRLVERSPQVKADPAQWVSFIQNAAGVKGEEVEWSGVLDWLQQRPSSVSRESILSYLRANEVKLQEVTLGAINGRLQEGWLVVKRDGYYAVLDEHGEVRGQGATSSEALDDTLDPDERDSAKGKYADYQIPGGSNYRELLLTLPDETAEQQRQLKELDEQLFIASLLPDPGQEYRRLKELKKRLLETPSKTPFISNHFGHANILVHVRFNERETVNTRTPEQQAMADELAEIDRQIERARKLALEARQARRRELTAQIDGRWQSGGFSSLGDYNRAIESIEDQLEEVGALAPSLPSLGEQRERVLSRMRANPFKPTVRTLFVEEVQSDWHQQGRKQGYALEKDDLVASRLEDNIEGRWKVANKRTGATVAMSMGLDAEEAIQNALAQAPGVPEAPFKESWPLLAMKRMIRYAAENGFERLAWTTGEQQIARFNLSKEVESIEYRLPASADLGSLTAYDLGGKKIIERTVQVGDLPSVVGKEVATRLLASEGPGLVGFNGQIFALAGEQLALGGAGMKAFYDQELVHSLNRYVKKWGARVEQAFFDPKNPQVRSVMADTVANLTALGGVPVHSLDLNSAMRESALAGQPLFSRTFDLTHEPGALKDVEAVRQALIERFGEKGIHSLVDSGVLRLVQSRAELPDHLSELQSRTDLRIRGLYDPDQDCAYIIAEEVGDADQAASTLLHEVGEHYGLQKMLGSRLYAELLDAVRGLREDPQIAASWAAVQRNLKHLQPGEDRFVREVIAHACERPDAISLSFLQRYASRVRQFLFRVGLFRVDWLKQSDILGLVVSSAKRAMSAPLRRPGVGAAQKSQERTSVLERPEVYSAAILAFNVATDYETRAARKRGFEGEDPWRRAKTVDEIAADKDVHPAALRDAIEEVFKAAGIETSTSDSGSSSSSYLEIRGSENEDGDRASAKIRFSDHSKESRLTERSAAQFIMGDGTGLREIVEQSIQAFNAIAESEGLPVIEAAGPSDQAQQDVPQTDAPAFKRWFGDSKVVDENGEPLVVYHGTSADFDTFRRSERGNFGAGIYFGSTPDQADNFATSSDDGGENIIPVYLSMKRPFRTRADYDAGESVDVDSPAVPLLQELYGKSAPGQIARLRNSRDGHLGKAVMDRLIAYGHDGIIASYSDGTSEYVAFYPEQIKSAIGNIGDFDPANPRIDLSAESAVSDIDPEQSPAFKRWFGSGKVVDADGSPLLVFHGTSAKRFTAFDTSAEGSHFGTSEQAAARLVKKQGGGGRARSVAAYLNLQNPLRLPDIGVWSNFNNLHRELSVGSHITDAQADTVWDAWNRSDSEGWKALKAALAEQGYDGIVYANDVEGIGDSYIAFHPEQIQFANRLVSKASPALKALPSWLESSQRVSQPSALNEDCDEILNPEEFDWEWRSGAVPLSSVFSDNQAFQDPERLASLLEQAPEQRRPIIVSLEPDGRLKLLDGGHRLALAKRDGIGSIPALIGIRDEVQSLLRDRAAPPVPPAKKTPPSLRATVSATVSAAFKKWFGRSKVVDALGHPRVVYHGTNSDFSVFQKGENRMSMRAEAGFWFASDPNDASRYGSTVMPIYLAIRKPKKITQRQLDFVAQERPMRETLALWQKQGFDGLYIPAIPADPALDEKGQPEQWVAFRPEQIKSAIGNRGHFDPLNPRIDFSAEPVAPQPQSVPRPGTPAFQRWFGESKIVDPAGRPLIVFHGTDADFDQFDYGEFGFHFGNEDQARSRGRKLMPVYLSIQNPIYFETDFSNWGDSEVVGSHLVERGILRPDELECGDLQGLLMQKGYDGYIYPNGFEGGGFSYAVFSPEQIKSAVSNQGTFDPHNPRIDLSAEPIERPAVSRTPPVTSSPDFRRWFGSSQVVDPVGAPRVVYHGTNQDIREFLGDRLGANTDSASCRGGFFFTEDAPEAGDYAVMSARKQVSNALAREANAERLLKAMDKALDRGNHDLYEKLNAELEESEQEAMSGEERGANIHPVYLQIANPLVFDMEGKNLHDMQQAIDEAKAHGHDGLRLLNVFDPVSNRPGLEPTTQWIAFRPEQIKSAIGNDGGFDPSNPRIDRRHRLEPQSTVSKTPTLAAFLKDSKVTRLSEIEPVPRIVYHGTQSDFESFDLERVGDLGFHFGSYRQANHFAKRKDGLVMACYLAIRNPLRLKDTFDRKTTAAQDTLWQLDRLGVVTREQGMDLRAMINSNHDYGAEGIWASWAALRNAIQDAGYDGVVYENENVKEGVGECWIAFRPEQIKSAFGNSGHFDPLSESILARRTPQPQGFGLRPDHVQAMLEDTFGREPIQKAIRSGALAVVDGRHNLPFPEETIAQLGVGRLSGCYDRQQGRAYLIASECKDQQDVVATFLHEFGEHHSLPRILGKRQYARLLDEVRRLRSDSPAVQQAWSVVEQSEPSLAPGSDRFVQEVVATLAEGTKAASLPLLQRLILSCRRFLFSYGLLTDRLTVTDIQGMVLHAASSEMKGARQSIPRESPSFADEPSFG